MNRRGELGERSFVQVLDYGGARRTPLRGRANLCKRYLVQSLCANLSLLMRHTVGIGTLNQSWAASAEALAALLAALCALLSRHTWLRVGRSLSPRLIHFAWTNHSPA
jgi:hypothetical protein